MRDTLVDDGPAWELDGGWLPDSELLGTSTAF